MNPIRHLIVLMMENRSFDHYLGALALEGRTDVDGLRNPLPINPDQRGRPVTAWNMDGTAPGLPDPPHGWDAMRGAYNRGRNNGFVRRFQGEHPDEDPRVPMGYYTRKTLPVYYSLADEFTLCDRWFGSLLSSTWPNRKYLHSGRRDDDRDTHIVPGLTGFRTTPLYEMLERTPNPDDPGKNLTWRYYFCDLPFLGFWYSFALEHTEHLHGIERFAEDCRADRLPEVSIVDPPYTFADDHPSHNPRKGQEFVQMVLNALTLSPSWDTSALVLLYDESGGFYDHVVPPAPFEGSRAVDQPLGFRVPALVVSPYAKRRHVSHAVYDHTSVLRSIAERWSVPFGPEFGPRWQHAPSVWDDCFDFTAPPRPRRSYVPSILRLQPSPEAHAAAGGADSETPATPSELEGLLARACKLPGLAGLDRRAGAEARLTALQDAVQSLHPETENAGDER